MSVVTTTPVLTPPPGAASRAVLGRFPEPAYSEPFGTVLGLLFRSRLFVGVLALKVAVGCLAASFYMRDLFAPFLNYYVSSGLSNPWTHFASLGRLNSFPYPPMMLYIMALPRLLLAPLLSSGVETVTPLHLAVLRLPLLAFDISIAALLAGLYPHRFHRILVMYWCSPIVFYVCYWHGQLDVIPTGLLLASAVLLGKGRFNAAMAVFAISAATKSHVWVALPFLLAYIVERHGKKAAAASLGLALAVYLAIVAPYATNPAFREMVFGSREQARVFDFQVPFGFESLSVLLAPFVLLCLLFRFLAYERRSWDLLLLYLGICFSCFVLLVPPQPGYVVWSIPFIVHFACRRRLVRALPIATYSLAYLAFFWSGPESDLFDAWRLVGSHLARIPSSHYWLGLVNPGLPVLVHNLIFTVMEASLGGIVLYMYMMGVRDTAAHSARKRPVLIGVAGDSGAGKDTFTTLLAALFGAQRTTVVCGDDYHRWERGHEMWGSMTHLHVAANDLHGQHRHVVGLSQGRTIFKATYDHDTGRFTDRQPCEPNDVVIFQGLHSLATVSLRNIYDLRIFLDPQEHLRQSWKIQRDTKDRSYSPEEVLRVLSSRSADRESYVLPQRERAELIIRWMTAEDESEHDSTQEAGENEIGLELRALNSFDLAPVVDALQSKSNLSVQYEPYLDATWQVVRLTGRVSAEILGDLAQDFAGGALTFFNTRPQFAEDLPGCVQLAALVCLRDKLAAGDQPPWSDF